MCILYNQRDAAYPIFFIIISAVHVSGRFSARNMQIQMNQRKIPASNKDSLQI
jgi:hypothetical protein